MRPSSAKAKGRRACQETKEALLKAFPAWHPDDVQVTSSGAPGEDLKLSPRAQSDLNLAFEVKNTETLQMWSALDQAEAHAKKRPGSIPAVVFRRNHTPLYITLKLEAFLGLIPKETHEDA